MTSESGAGPEGTESPDGESEWTQDQQIHYFAEDDEDEEVSGLNHLVQRNV